VARLTKNQKVAQSKIEANKAYSLQDASSLVKDITTTKFDSSVDIDVRLGVDPRKANQMVRGIATLPHGTGKTVRVLVLCTPDKDGWTDVDIIITMPSVMAKVGRLGRILGPRNLMPNPKSGTVTADVGKAVTEVKAGKIDFKVDKTGIIHASIGKVSFPPEKIYENALEVLQTISKLKPSAAKGTYFKSIHLSSTMSPGIEIETKTVAGI
jgi:large subunit ribosomal protein L1